MQVAIYSTMNNGCSVNKLIKTTNLGLCVVPATLETVGPIPKHQC